MIEYFGLILHCIMAIMLGVTAHDLYSLIKMAEASINDLLPEVSRDPPESEVKKLIECVLTGKASYIWVKARRKNKLTNLVLKSG